MRISLTAALMVAVVALAGNLLAQDDAMPAQEVPVIDDYGVCCDCSRWVGEFEATIFRYHREAGFDGNEYDMSIDPRVTLGYESCDGLGVRARYWDFYEVSDPGDESVDTYNVDLEIYRVVEWSCDTTVEIFGGFRYNSFREKVSTVDLPIAFQEPLTTNFNGWGTTIGLEAKTCTCWGTLYARGRYSVLMGDMRADLLGDGGEGFLLVPEDRSDHLVDQQEITLGIERDVCLLGGHGTLGVGIEVANWSNYSGDLGFEFLPQGVFRDVGFRGLVLSFGTSY